MPEILSYFCAPAKKILRANEQAKSLPKITDSFGCGLAVEKS
jgi:hypothetical protein